MERDTYSSLIYVMNLIPLSIVQHNVNAQYNLRKKNGLRFNYLPMVKLKSLAKIEPEIKRLVETMHLCSKDIELKL